MNGHSPQTHRKLRNATQSVKNRNSQNRNSQWFEALETRRFLSASIDAVANITAVTDLTIVPDATSTTVQGYTPAQIKKAYGISSVSLTGAVTGDGSGQTIAIVDAYNDPNISSDLATFDSKFSLSAPPSFVKESQTGSTTSLPSSNAGWDQEISLDVEWAHAIAPKAKLVLVEAKSDSLSDLLTAVNTARNISGVSVVSLSWGASEFYGETSYDSLFTTPAGHTGVTFVASSGDEGSWDGASWPSVSSNVLAVGGTTLSLQDSSGTYGSETAWSDSGGGVSFLEPEPSYQSQYGSAQGKVAPDVAYDANPNTGFAVYSSVSYQGHTGWEEVGGTSAGAPQWSALIAIADQGRALNHLGTLDGATGTLPSLYSLYATSASYSSGFHDITQGASSWWFGATPGFDAVTGLGTPKATTIVSILGGGASSSSSKTTTTTTKTTTTIKNTTVTNHHASSSIAIVANRPVATSLSHRDTSMFSDTRLDSSASLIDSIAVTGASNDQSASTGGNGSTGTGSGGGEGTGSAHMATHSFSVHNEQGQALSLTHHFNDDAMVTASHGLLGESDSADLPANVEENTRLIAEMNAAHLAAAARAEVLPDNWQTAAALVGAAVLVGAYASNTHRKRAALMGRGFDFRIDD